MATENHSEAAILHANGVELCRQGQFQDGIRAFESALLIDPDHTYATAALAQVFAIQKRFSEAIPLFQKTVADFPADADMHGALGDCCHSTKQFGPAIESYLKTLEMDPTRVGTWYSLGCAQTSLQAYAAAVRSFRQALALRPDWPEAQHNLGRALFEIGQIEEAMDMFRAASNSPAAQLPMTTMAVIAPGSGKCDNQQLFELRRKWADRYLPVAQPDTRAAVTANESRIPRIGYVSSFFHRPNWMKPVWGLINQHDRDKFEIHLFSDAPASAISSGYEKHDADKFHDISKCSNEQAADLMKQCELDLLIDLNSYSAVERMPILALRPAPRIAAWFNLYAPSGCSFYDYLIGDTTVIPPEEEIFYSEKIKRVPGSYLTFHVSYAVPNIGEPRTGQTAITFGCLASQHKITSEVIAAWSRILHGSPRSQLILKNATLGSMDVQQFVRGLFETHGVAAERIRLDGPSGHSQFLKTYDEIDIALDTFPYNGGTTTTEALWQGVPVLTFYGDRWVSRTSASLLKSANLGQFVRDNLNDYVNYAIELANSPWARMQLFELRTEMRGRLLASTVCDTQTFARNMERIYTDIITMTGAPYVDPLQP